MEARCTECSKLLAGKLMQYHMRYFHNKKTITYACAGNLCNRTFHNLNSLRNHYRKCNNKLSRNIDVSTCNYDANINYDNCESEDFITIYKNISSNLTENVKKLSFFENALKIASTLYGDVKLSRIQAEKIITLFEEVLNCESLNSLKEFVIKHIDESVLDEFKTRFNDLQSSFSQINTQHKCFAELRKRNYLMDSETITYGYREELNVNAIKYVKSSGSVISIAFILKKFFEIPNVFMKTIDYLTKLQ